MQTILVTGAGGYIGTTLTPMLLERGYGVRAIDRFFFGGDLLKPHDDLEIVKEDTRKLTPGHFKGVHGVIDLSALSNDPSGELFRDATWAINCDARVNCAKLAKAAGARRYVLPSSCSIYGFQDAGIVADEGFCVTVVRQSTVYGLSPRMRFDLAINGMTHGAWKTGRLPLMRDGSQWRPMVHVTDTARAQILMLEADEDKVSGELFNVGSAENVYQIGPLADIVADLTPRDVEIAWYGDPDHRSYRVAFDKIEALGYKAEKTAADGVAEIHEALKREWSTRRIKRSRSLGIGTWPNGMGSFAKPKCMEAWGRFEDSSAWTDRTTWRGHRHRRRDSGRDDNSLSPGCVGNGRWRRDRSSFGGIGSRRRSQHHRLP